MTVKRTCGKICGCHIFCIMKKRCCLCFSRKIDPCLIPKIEILLINGGNYYKPHVVKQLRSSNGEVVSNIEPTLVKQTISKETSDKLRKYMKETVDSGTGTKAKMKDYTAGGKTGTAQ